MRTLLSCPFIIGVISPSMAAISATRAKASASTTWPSGYQCVDNPDSETNQQYPYMVASTDGIADNLLPNVNLSAPRFYDLGGRQHQRQQSGLNIIRKGGKTVKTMVR